MIRVERLSSEQALGIVDGLISLLQDAVDNGASIGFLLPLGYEEAHHYWLDVVEEVARKTKILLVAYKDEKLVGTGQLALATRPNAPHRAEVQKLFVHTGARQQGIAQVLMKAIEEEAYKAGRSLLVLDTRQGDPSEQLYQKLGYIQAGIIPQYVIDETGQFSATVVYYRII